MVALTETATAVSEAIDDGTQVYVAGFSHLVPVAVGHEIVRQGVTDLDLVRLAPDLIYDQLIAAGCVSTATFSWAGNPGIGNLRSFRRAVEDDVPRPIAVEEYTHFGLISRLAAGAKGLPFLPLRTFRGSDLVEHRDDVRRVENPFAGGNSTGGDGTAGDGEEVVVPPLEPDVAVIGAQRADREGNVQVWGIVGDVVEAAFAADTVVVSVEEVVEPAVVQRDPNRTLIPASEVDYLVEEPFGSHPSYAQGYYDRDDGAYFEWEKRSRSHEAVEAWLDEWVYGVSDRREYCEKLGDDRLDALRVDGARIDRESVGGGTSDDGTGDGGVGGERTEPTGRRGATTDPTDPTATELMVASAARELGNDDTVLVGVGVPVLACLLAKRTHAPEAQLLYESGAIDADPQSLPLSTADPSIAAGAHSIVPMYDVFTQYLQAGRIDVGFLGGAQIDRRGNVNSTVIGAYDAPTVRLPGSGGACEIASNTQRTILVTPHEKRRFPESVDFVTSPGYVGGREGRTERGLRGGPTVVITDKAVLRFDERGETYVETLHPGVSRDAVQEATGWEIRFAEDVGETPLPDEKEVRLMREDLDPEGIYR